MMTKLPVVKSTTLIAFHLLNDLLVRAGVFEPLFVVADTVVLVVVAEEDVASVFCLRIWVNL